MTKRKFGLGLSLVLAAGTILGACGAKDDETTSTGSKGTDTGTAETESFSIAMITDVGGVDDKSFNQSAWEGIQAWGAEHGLEKGEGGFDYLQSAGDADYMTNLNNLVRRDFDIVYGIGFLLEEPIATIADQKPDNKFVILDGVAEKPNVVSVMFKEQEVAYLAGVAAALMSETKKIGFIGGMEIPVIERFQAGFVEGVKAVDPSIKVDVQYTGKFDDAALGKTTANRMYGSGVDIIAHAAGGTGNGVFAEAKERKTKDANSNVWVIGVDSDQYAEGAVGDTNITLTSMLKKVGTAVQEVANNAMAGNFPGGTTVTYGLAENGVELADSRGVIPQDVLDQIQEYSDKVASGEITVPETVK